LALTLSVAPLLLGCSSDDEGNGGTGPNASDFVGTWNATDFVADGTDLVAAGVTIAFTFTETTYAFAVTNDTNSVLCDPGVTTCGEGGSLASTETTITFDPGSSDQVTFTYNVTGTVMTVSGTVDGTVITATFQEV